jgi:hypothetical protein
MLQSHSDDREHGWLRTRQCEDPLREKHFASIKQHILNKNLIQDQLDTEVATCWAQVADILATHSLGETRVMCVGTFAERTPTFFTSNNEPTRSKNCRDHQYSAVMMEKLVNNFEGCSSFIINK